ncbi:MAG TPA: pirin family protein [Gammaproteobacteria bacterium]|nr:pirin family protein [Gammaproteobacteria bacterium]
MFTLRPARERGHADHGWLDSWHSFSFADYYDPEHMGYSVLRVINDDRIAKGGGFGPHPHRDMEIVTYILEGALAHRDSMGNGSVIRPGDVQRMSAGSGVVHSEVNSHDGETRLLQIWILPQDKGGAPGYEQIHFSEEDLRDRLRLIASPEGREGSVLIQQDAAIHAGRLTAGTKLQHRLSAGKKAYLQVAGGELRVQGSQMLKEGDGLMAEAEQYLDIEAVTDSELLLFELP